MPTPYRLSINLTDPQREALRIEADRLEIKVSDLIRRILDDWRTARGETTTTNHPGERT